MKNRTIKRMLAAAFASLMLADAASAYYSPRLGRFLSRDPIAEPGAVLVRQAARPATSFIPRDPEQPPPISGGVNSDLGLGNAKCRAYGSSYVGRLPIMPTEPLHEEEELNLYQYAKGAPTNRVDPLGLSTKCGTRFCLCCEKGTRRVNVYGDSARAKFIIEAGFGKGAQGCVTLLNWFTTGAEIYCTMSCEDIKNSYSPTGVAILDHECCHACDYFDKGVVKYLDGAINDTCESRPRVGWETW